MSRTHIIFLIFFSTSNAFSQVSLLRCHDVTTNKLTNDFLIDYGEGTVTNNQGIKAKATFSTSKISWLDKSKTKLRQHTLDRIDGIHISYGLKETGEIDWSDEKESDKCTVAAQKF